MQNQQIEARKLSPLLVAGLGVLQFLLAAFMLYMLVNVGFLSGMTASVSLTVLTVGVAIGATALLTRLVPNKAVVWVVCFSIIPIILVPLMAYEYFVHGHAAGFAYWSTFSVALLASCMLGVLVGQAWRARTTVHSEDSWLAGHRR